ncbi:MAG: hypothetical protein SNJ82_00640 [Gemmataceae bacterium]
MPHRTVASVILLFFASLSVSRGQPEIASEDLIEKIKAYYANYNNMLMDIVYSMHVISRNSKPTPGGSTLYRQSLIKVGRSGDKIKRAAENFYLDSKTKKVGRVPREVNERILIGQKELSLSYGEKGAVSGVARRDKKSNQDLLIDDLAPLIQPNLLYGGQSLFYWLERDAKPEYTIDREKVGKTDTVVLRVKSRLGNCSIYCDPLRNYMPLKIEDVKGTTHLSVDGVPFGSIPADDGGPIHEIKTTVTAQTIEMVSGRSIPKRFSTEFKLSHGKRKLENSDRHDVLITKFEIMNHPDSYFRPRTPIPNGQRVSVENQPQIPYEWRDGEVVKVVDPETLANLDQVQFRSDRGWLWPALILGLVSVAGITAFFLWRWYRSRETS